MLDDPLLTLTTRGQCQTLCGCSIIVFKVNGDFLNVPCNGTDNCECGHPYSMHQSASQQSTPGARENQCGGYIAQVQVIYSILRSACDISIGRDTYCGWRVAAMYLWPHSCIAHDRSLFSLYANQYRNISGWWQCCSLAQHRHYTDQYRGSGSSYCLQPPH
jgi:hypothetical protein